MPLYLITKIFKKLSSLMNHSSHPFYLYNQMVHFGTNSVSSAAISEVIVKNNLPTCNDHKCKARSKNQANDENLTQKPSQSALPSTASDYKTRKRQH